MTKVEHPAQSSTLYLNHVVEFVIMYAEWPSAHTIDWLFEMLQVVGSDSEESD